MIESEVLVPSGRNHGSDRDVALQVDTSGESILNDRTRIYPLATAKQYHLVGPPHRRNEGHGGHQGDRRGAWIDRRGVPVSSNSSVKGFHPSLATLHLPET